LTPKEIRKKWGLNIKIGYPVEIVGDHKWKGGRGKVRRMYVSSSGEPMVSVDLTYFDRVSNKAIAGMCHIEACKVKLL